MDSMAQVFTLKATLWHLPPAPQASTDHDLRKLTHRMRAIDSVHNSLSYRICAAQTPQLLPAEPCPTLPHQRMMSKREWKKIVQKWRIDLRDLAASLD
jgi:hypothetical protein